MLVRDDLLEDQSVNEDSHRSHVRREDLQAVEPLVVNAEVRESPHEDNIVEEEADVVLGKNVESLNHMSAYYKESSISWSHSFVHRC